MPRPVRDLLVIGAIVGTGALQASAHSQSPPRRALLVAVNGYEDIKLHPSKTSVHSLDTTPDVERIKGVLKTRWKFQDNEIKILKTPAETTHEGIVKAFRAYLLDPALKGKGAVIFFHYSGHGSQWPDKTDKNELDQTLVPSDYKSKNDGSNDITDKEIAGLLKELNANQPASVFLSFDSCHSGTITRGAGGKERGFVRQLPPMRGQARGPELAGGVVPPGEAAQWGYTVISACRSDQSDYQITDEKGVDMGSLSYALCRALSDATPTTTYRDVFNRVQSIMLDKAPNQEPQIEGLSNQALFSDKTEKPEAAIGVYTHNGEARIQAGFLMGVTPGTQVALYRRGAQKMDEASRIGTAVVGKSVDSTEAVITPTLAPGVKIGSLEGARAVITQRRCRDKPLRVDLSAIAGHPQEAALRAALKPLCREGEGMIEIAPPSQKNWDVRLVPPAGAFGNVKVAFQKEEEGVWNVTDPAGKARGAGPTSSSNAAPVQLRGGDPAAPGSLALQYSDGTFLTLQVGDTTRYAQILDNDPQLARDTREALRRMATAHMLRALKAQAGNGFIKAQIQIVPCKVKMVRSAQGKEHAEYAGDLPLPQTAGGVTQFEIGQHFYIKTQNLGMQAAYLTVLDLSAEGRLSPLWPHPSLGDISTVVPAGQDWKPIISPFDNKVVVYNITEPMGKETFWTIATEKPTNFTPILSPQTRGKTTGAARGAEESPLGRMLRSGQSGTRAAPEDIDPGDFALSDYHFTVVPAAKP